MATTDSSSKKRVTDIIEKYHGANSSNVQFAEEIIGIFEKPVKESKTRCADCGNTVPNGTVCSCQKKYE